MADDAATILSTPPPDWNPGAQPTGTILDVPPPVQQSMNVTAPQAQPVQTQPAPQSDDMVQYPEAPPYPSADQHISWLHKVANTVADALGPDEIATVHKNPDTGEINVIQHKASHKEKWGRIAALALGGAAEGLANSQGPGGIAKAAAAGTQYGLEQPQKQQQRVNEEATAEQKRVYANANNAIFHQQAYKAILDNQALESTIGDKDAANFNTLVSTLQDSPNSKDWGRISGWADLDRVRQDPDFLKHHTNQQLTAMPVRGKNGQVELHAISTDKTEDQQMVGKGDMVLGWEIDPKTGEPHSTLTPASPNSRTKGELKLYNQGKAVEYLNALTKYGTYKKDTAAAEREKIPTTQDAAIIEEELNKTPNDRAGAYERADKRIQANKEKLRTINQVSVGAGITPGTPITELIKPGAKFAPGTIEGTNAQKLATGDMTLDEIPKRLAKGAPTPQDYAAAGEAYSQYMYGLPYSPTLIDNEKKLFNNPKMQATMDGIDKMIGTQGQPGFLDQVLHLAQQTGMSDTAPLNEIVRKIKTKFGDQAYKNFNTALSEVQRSLPQLIGNPLMGGSDTDLKLKMAQDMFGANPTLGNLRSTAGELATMMGTTRDSYARDNRFLQRRYGLKGAYAAGGASSRGTPTGNPQAGAAAGPAAGPAAGGTPVQAPAGATMEYKDGNGNVTGWAVNGKYVAR